MGTPHEVARISPGWPQILDTHTHRSVDRMANGRCDHNARGLPEPDRGVAIGARPVRRDTSTT